MNPAPGLRLLRLACLLLPAACATSTAPGPAGSGEPAGAAIDSREFGAILALYPDDYLRNYVDAIGRRLSSVAPRREPAPAFAILDRGEPLLLSTRDGRIAVSRGLLALVKREDELAGLLAHAIAHLGTGAADRRAPGEPLRFLEGELGRLVAADLQAASLLPAGATLQLREFDDVVERRIDALALARTAAAGYEPAALAGFLRRLQRVRELLPDWQANAFLAVHRFSPERIAAIEAAGRAPAWQPVRPFARGRDALLKRLDGLDWGPGNPQQGLFIGSRFLQPDMGIRIDFPPGWTPINAPGFVGARQADGEALLLVNAPRGTAPPAELARVFAERVARKTGSQVPPPQAFAAGPWPGYWLRVEALDAGLPLVACYAWVQAAGTTFRLLGAGLAGHAEAFCDSVRSLRPLDPAERAEIRALRLRAVAARPGERLAALGERSGNRWPVELTAAINGLEAGAALPAGYLVKILRAETYY
ncbi:MAG: hypothetical protein D6727_02845 [Gammaproteobacteria bacterium]|nr:MAG: hypothetical protein D6727_02845 [Gammaproteobacteria bacterium]